MKISLFSADESFPLAGLCAAFKQEQKNKKYSEEDLEERERDETRDLSSLAIKI